nr:dTDP-D-glucose 4; 6-dehydratase-like isoform X2 [Biomphalaria glabrata]
MASSMIGNQVLVLGGTGFIGRNLVDYLVRNSLAKKIRVVDKVPPQMAWLNPRHSESFASPAVEFCHANLINKASAEKAFSDSGEFDFVINLAAETKYGQSEPVYKEGIFRLSMNCAELAAKHKVKKYIEVSTAQVYSHEKKPSREDSKSEPWTNLARHKLEVEHALENFTDLNYVIVRPTIVYGLGDRNGLTPRLIIGAIYKYMKQKMQMLWTKDLKMNTVHVDDAVRALWHLCFHGNRGQVYNLCDKGDTSQGLISSLISELFDINYDFLGSVFSNLARVRMTDIVDDINEKHVRPWSDACQRDKITNTPLNPFIDQELLYNKHLYVDGSKIESLGFTYHVPRLEVSSLKSILDDYIGLGLMPSSLVSNEVFYTPPEHEEAGIDAGGDGDASSDLAEDTTSS